MVTDLEPPQTGFTISMFLIEKKQQVILFPRQKLLHKNRGSLNSLWLGSQQAAIPDTLAGTFTASSASLNWQLSTLNWGEGWKKKLIDVIREKYPNLLRREWRSLPWLSDKTECVSMKCSYEAISVREPTHIRNYLRKIKKIIIQIKIKM